MAVQLTILGAAAFAVLWTVTALIVVRPLGLVSVLLLVCGPLAAELWLPSDDKYALAAVVAAPLGGLVVGQWRAARRSAHPARDFAAHPLFPFAALYAAAASYGLAWGLLRGNEPGLVLGQAWTATLFACGFGLAGPLLARRADARVWLTMIGGVALTALPGLLPFVAWLGGGGEATFMRFLHASAFYAPLCVLIALVLVRPTYPRTGSLAAAFFVLLTLLSFTRSYWMGLAVGGAVLAAAAAARWLRVPAQRPRPSLRGLAGAGSALAVTAALALATPVGAFALERVAMTSQGSADMSVDVRTFELQAALETVARAPELGIGAGGQFASLHQIGDDQVAYGATNFVHNAYLYFPLKFGVLGFAALFALLGGLAVVLTSALRRSGVEGPRAAVFPALLAAVLALSLTAPNLVDPTYSVFIGALVYLAGASTRLPTNSPCPKSA